MGVGFVEGIQLCHCMGLGTGLLAQDPLAGVGWCVPGIARSLEADCGAIPGSNHSWAFEGLPSFSQASPGIGSGLCGVIGDRGTGS